MLGDLKPENSYQMNAVRSTFYQSTKGMTIDISVGQLPATAWL